jgi:hypothetical protein
MKELAVGNTSQIPRPHKRNQVMTKHENTPNDRNKKDDEPKKSLFSYIESLFSGLSSNVAAVFGILEKLINSVSECVQLLIKYKPEEGASVLRWLITLSAVVICVVMMAITVIATTHASSTVQPIELRSTKR